MSKYTPGSWRADCVVEDGETTAIEIRSEYGLFIADVEPHAPEHADPWANALLIAAAPDLLEVLKDIRAERAPLSVMAARIDAVIDQAEGTYERRRR